MFKQSAILLLATMAIGSMAMPDPLNIAASLSDEYIENLNSIQSSWTAGRNFDKNIDPAFIRSLMGTIIDENEMNKVPLLKEQKIAANLPEVFDSRNRWPKCQTMKIIRDQSECGSCWAFGAVEAISDRICVASNQTMTDVMVSAQDLLACCLSCGQGCQGGYPSAAWAYWVNNGLVTGGLYGDKKTCKPYGFPSCEHHVQGPLPQCNGYRATPHCERQCQTGFSRAYGQDKYYGKNAHRIYGNVQQIQNEIMTNGPVEAAFTVYDDFLNYKSGVYQKTPSAKGLGGHAIKVLGWGVENGTPYWLCANSWNEDWGDKGYFKIYRGSNHCGIENDIEFGLPALE